MTPDKTRSHQLLNKLLGDAELAKRGLADPYEAHRKRALADHLAALEPEDFGLAGDTATVTLAARFNKNRKPRVQPLPGDVAEVLSAYLADRPAGQPICAGTWASGRRAAAMLQLDLEAAGIPYGVRGRTARCTQTSTPCGTRTSPRSAGAGWTCGQRKSWRDTLRRS